MTGKLVIWGSRGRIRVESDDRTVTVFVSDTLDGPTYGDGKSYEPADVPEMLHRIFHNPTLDQSERFKTAISSLFLA